MPARRARRNVLVRGLAAAAAALAAWVAWRSWSVVPFDGCDNEAGTCLRTRQVVAIQALAFAALLAGAAQLWFAVAGDQRALRARVAASLLVAAALLAVLVADVAGRLADAHTGWLS